MCLGGGEGSKVHLDTSLGGFYHLTSHSWGGGGSQISEGAYVVHSSYPNGLCAH